MYPAYAILTGGCQPLKERIVCFFQGHGGAVWKLQNVSFSSVHGRSGVTADGDITYVPRLLLLSPIYPRPFHLVALISPDLK